MNRLNLNLRLLLPLTAAASALASPALGAPPPTPPAAANVSDHVARGDATRKAGHWAEAAPATPSAGRDDRDRTEREPTQTLDGTLGGISVMPVFALGLTPGVSAGGSFDATFRFWPRFALGRVASDERDVFEKILVRIPAHQRQVVLSALELLASALRDEAIDP